MLCVVLDPVEGGQIGCSLACLRSTTHACGTLVKAAFVTETHTDTVH